MQANLTYQKIINLKIMNSILLSLISFLLISCNSENDSISFEPDYQEESIELPALRINNSFTTPYRVLKTTIKDESAFDAKYGNTDLSIGYVLRYYFYTAIDLDSEENVLISMDQSSFDMPENTDGINLVRNAISIIGGMSFGSVEYREFVNKYFEGCIDLSKKNGSCVTPSVYEPVCGCNGFTYSNRYEAECDGVIVFREGPCN